MSDDAPTAEGESIPSSVDANALRSDEDEPSKWEYAGITSWVHSTAPSDGDQSLHIESVLAIQTRPVGPDVPGEYRRVFLTEDNRVGPGDGGAPHLDDMDWDRSRRVGVVTDYRDNGRIGVVYAERDPHPNTKWDTEADAGPHWYWVPVSTEHAPGIGDEGLIADHYGIHDRPETPDDQPDRGAEVVAWIDEEAYADSVGRLVNDLDRHDAVEWFKADVDPEDYPDTEEDD